MEPIHQDFREDPQVITVILKGSKSGAKNFKCLNCSKLLFIYHSNIKLIFEGRIIQDSGIIEVRCSRCFIDYIIANGLV